MGRARCVVSVVVVGCSAEAALPGDRADDAASHPPLQEAAPPSSDARPDDPSSPTLFVGAGDIAKCTALGLAGIVKDPHERTAELVLDYPPTTPVFTLGDNVYSDGTPLEFATCYARGWGAFKDRTNPVAGNHDYNTADAEGYYEYFGARAGDPAKGYYAYDVGAWRVIVLNSNCADVACGEGSAQLAWLRAELAANSKPCTMAMWHHPRFSSDRAGTNDLVRPFYSALYEADADLVLVGHAHSYERFAPIDPDGNVDTTRGIRQLVVGSGGADLRPKTVDQPASERFVDDVHGILELALYADRYEWRFVPVEGSSPDSGVQGCH